MKKLEGKVAVVTGASKGIGASIARHLAAEGASVVVNYSSDKDGANRTVADITAKGGKAIAVRGNLSKQADIAPLFEEAKKAYGQLDILVNNAGVYEFTPIEQITPEHFHKIFDLNVLGLLLTTQEALKHFGPNGGNIVNISSVVSTKGIPGSAVYSGTKGAVDSITRVLAHELGARKIRVNSVNPGMVETEGTTTAGFTAAESDFRKQVEAETPVGRIGQPKDIGAVVAFLASDDAAWVSGESWFVSGGLR
jgi:3-oxoacyl-[acyl-carrier protein] reductase